MKEVQSIAAMSQVALDQQTVTQCADNPILNPPQPIPYLVVGVESTQVAWTIFLPRDFVHRCHQPWISGKEMDTPPLIGVIGDTIERRWMPLSGQQLAQQVPIGLSRETLGTLRQDRRQREFRGNRMLDRRKRKAE